MTQQGGIGSILAWHIGLVKDGTPTTGMVHNHTDNSHSEAKDFSDCYAVAGNLGGGPLWAVENVGGKDIHIVGKTADGKDISPVHFSTKALFHLLDRDRKFFKATPDMFDGPLLFEENVQERPPIPSFPFLAKSHINWDSETSWEQHSHPAYGQKRGIWHIWTEIPFGGSDGGGKPPKEPPPPGDPTPVDPVPPGNPEPDPGRHPPKVPGPTTEPTPPKPPSDPKPPERITSGGGGSGGGTSGYLGTPLQHAFGDIKAKGVPNNSGIVGGGSGGGAPNIKDYRTWNTPENRLAVETWMNRAPVTGILTAFYGYKDGNWQNPTYTQKPHEDGGDGKYKSGTASGGWFVSQPESDITDLRVQNADGTDPLWIQSGSSNTIFGMLPGVKLFQGYPDMDTGAVKKGYSSYIDYATNKVKHSVKEFSGTETNFMDYPGSSTDNLNVKVDFLGDKDIALKGSTSFKHTLTSTPTADRIGTIQNSSGTFAWTSDIVNQGWTRSGTNLAPTNAGDTVAITDSSTVPTLRGVTDTNSGISIASDILYFWTGGSEVFRGDSSGNIQARGDLWWKSATSYLGKFEHNNTADRAYTFPDNAGTVAFATGLSGNQTIYGSTGGTGSLFLKGNSVDDAGMEIDQLGYAYLDRDYIWYSATAYTGQLTHNNSANRAYAYPDETGTVKLIKDQHKFFDSGVDNYSAHKAYAIVAGKTGYCEFICPSDYSSLTSLNLVLISTHTDSSVSVTRTSEYGANTEQHNNDTSNATSNLNLTAGKITNVSISALFTNMVASDRCGLSVLNNDASSRINVLGIEMVYTPTN